ncbi:MAG TPA: TolC family protein [Bryobacteraceae bacterium]|nr:TolC family protein [Bryobacteraceae bacterium]
MMRPAFLFVVTTAAALAETRTLTLREAVDLAVRQNPEVIMARLDEQKAQESVRIARDPFSPKVVLGSGLGKTFGFPMSIEGSAPSIFQARAIQSLYNKPRSYEVAAARENARATTIDTAARREDVAHRTALLYLDAHRAARGVETARQLIGTAEKLASTVEARVSEGRELPIENRRAALRLAQARQRLLEFEAAQEQTESALAVVLGFKPEDRVRTAAEDPASPELPADEAASIDAALANNKEVQRIESAMQARGLEARAARAAWLPQMDLVAQYAMFARFNNYEDYFQRFSRNNAQLGASIAFPIFPGAGSKARAAQADLEVTRLRTQANALRDRVTLDTRKAWSDVRRAESGRDLARLDLEFTREQLSVILAQAEEGRASFRQVEEVRAAESEKWIAYYDALHTLERARIDLVRLTGTILAAVR